MLAANPALKKNIETCFGKKILSHKECLDLQTEILQKTGSLLSINTLRCFFQLIKSSHAPSVATLNVLASFCGYHSYSEWLRIHGDKEAPEENADLLFYVISIFRNTPVEGSSDKTFAAMAYNTIQFLNSNPHLAQPFQQAIAKTVNGQNFYFEPFVNTDKLNSYYGDGLRYYVLEKKDDQSQIFGHSLLALRYWLTANDDLVLKHCAHVLHYKATPEMNPFVSGRYFGALVLKAKVQKMGTQKALLEARTFYKTLLDSRVQSSVVLTFELTYGSWLIMSGEWQEGIEFVEMGQRKLKTENPQQNLSEMLQTINALRALGLIQLDRRKEALAVFVDIDPTKFYLLVRQFSNILYLQVGISLKQLKDNGQLSHLMNETGFVRLVLNKKNPRKV